jgi:hypothetical protein
MTWVYKQSTGALLRLGQTVGMGYSGNGAGKNNPAMQNVPNVGPIPEGRYTINDPIDSPKVGPYALPLDPMAGTNTFGRSDFLIHGDSIVHPGEASEGCIILLRSVRQEIIASDDRDLDVIA